MANNQEDTLSKFIRLHAPYITIKDKDEEITRKCLLKSQARSNNLDDTLSMKTHDPLWMLSRQMEMGEFRGNNAGTALSVKCVVREYPMQEQDPIEYMVERVPVDITPKVMVESALHYLKLAKKYGEAVVMKSLQDQYPFDPDYTICGVDDSQVKSAAAAQNSRLANFLSAYKGKVFDGYGLYKHLMTQLRKKDCRLTKAEREYCGWFSEKYATGHEQLWDVKQLGYKDSRMDISEKGGLVTQGYAGGRLSWYSFDYNADKVAKGNGVQERTIYSLPTMASYAGAPCKRLWQFEDHKVYLGNTEEATSQASALFMQFATMYSNDWMLIPLDSRLGTFMEVESLEVKDTFGETFTAESTNTNADKAATYDQRWRMFNVAPEDLKKGKELSGMLLPQVFADIVESGPVEEVHFLRDEMANMVWGVETAVQDGTGYSLDNSAHANSINDIISGINEKNIAKTLNYAGALTFLKNKNDETEITPAGISDYSYMIQNTVPLNYIPFVPQHIIKEDGNLDNRETVLRRGKMPCFVYTDDQAQKNYYLAVRPVSTLIECQFRDKSSEKEIPLKINEEEILQTGVKIAKTFQQGRWFNGKRYHWLGISKQLNEMDANSGLTYDKLKYK